MNDAGLFFVVARWAKWLVMLPRTDGICRDATWYERTMIPSLPRDLRPRPPSFPSEQKDIKEVLGMEWILGFEKHRKPAIYPAKYQPNICLIFGQWLVGYPSWWLESLVLSIPKSRRQEFTIKTPHWCSFHYLPPQRNTRWKELKCCRNWKLMINHDGVSSHVQWISSQAKSVQNRNHLLWSRHP